LERRNKVWNRRNNADLERKYKGKVPLPELKDVLLLEEKERRFQKFQLASGRLLDAIKELRSTARDKERSRHIPVVRDEKLVGVVSIGDMVKHQLAECQYEHKAMREYIATG
jgi:CBS domain-containing protein